MTGSLPLGSAPARGKNEEFNSIDLEIAIVDEDPSSHRELLLEGIALFNDGNYFDSHELLEEIWFEIIGPEKRFLQGLIRSATALYHYREGNMEASRRMILSALELLEPHRPDRDGVNVEKMINALNRIFAWATQEPPLEAPPWDTIETPKIDFV